ncbi:RNA polymerase sigma factor SigE [Neomicrococcus aestuarii]|uniref:RNA polymerase sigma factor SigE n=1 Tax=Neomicrococcus aestuarii TaxID=556325 RepID=A0A1L2ZSJ2_9MICC|nr:RNA polymerase sigma factor SigE [Neomicrococcus aestuarii]
MSCVKDLVATQIPPVAEAPDVPSWEEIVADYSAQVYRLAYRLTGNRQDAEDLTQETFFRVFRSLHAYEPGTFGGWLHRITTNLFLDQTRRKQRIRFDAFIDGSEERVPATNSGPERVFEEMHLDLDVQRALDELPAEFRAAVVLCDLEGLPYNEVAEILGVKLGTVRSRIHRGRTMLREKLAHRAPTQPSKGSLSTAGMKTAITGLVRRSTPAHAQGITKG